MSTEKTTDLTKGRPISQIFLFAVPLVLGTLFQQLYSFADTVIVGRFLGVDALAAVGTTFAPKLWARRMPKPTVSPWTNPRIRKFKE